MSKISRIIVRYVHAAIRAAFAKFSKSKRNSKVVREQGKTSIFFKGLYFLFFRQKRKSEGKPSGIANPLTIQRMFQKVPTGLDEVNNYIAADEVSERNKKLWAELWEKDYYVQPIGEIDEGKIDYLVVSCRSILPLTESSHKGLY